jgi:radical SAM superfamily enzyme YgiQ (UPF0313 family)
VKIALFKTLQRAQWTGNKYNRRFLGFSCLQDYAELKCPEHEVRHVFSVDELKACKPDVIGISSVSETWSSAVALVNGLRAGGFSGPIIVGGPHVMAIPSQLPSLADCAVIGEGEETFVELIRAYADHRRPDLSQIAGIAHRPDDSSGVVMTARRAPMNMDALPVNVARDPDTTFQISTIRGCPFRCGHCVEGPTQGKTRWLSAERLYEIMRERVRVTGNREFYFQDDTFLAARGRLAKLHEIMRRENAMTEFRIKSISLNANLVNDDAIRMMLEIGARHGRFGMGCESLNPRILGEMKRGVVTLEHITQTAELCSKHGAKIGGSQVYGWPGETPDEIRDSIRRVKELERATKFKHWVVYACQPLPGSSIWNRALAHGDVSEDMDFSTLRIDGNMGYFDTPWFWLNEATTPKSEFLSILRDEGHLPRGFFV